MHEQSNYQNFQKLNQRKTRKQLKNELIDTSDRLP